MDCSPWGRKESGTTERLTLSHEGGALMPGFSDLIKEAPRASLVAQW